MPYSHTLRHSVVKIMPLHKADCIMAEHHLRARRCELKAISLECLKDRANTLYGDFCKAFKDPHHGPFSRWPGAAVRRLGGEPSSKEHFRGVGVHPEHV